MAGVRLEIGLDDAKVRQVLGALQQVTKDLRAPLREIGEEAHSMAMDAFESETSPGGVAWKPSKRAVKTGGKTLSDTGALKSSIDVAAFPNKVLIGSNLVYAAIHQFGGDAGRGHKVHLPARPYLPSEEDMDQGFIFDVLSRHLARALS